MVSQRDRILKTTEYLKSLGIEVYIGKNSARGNKGFFKAAKNKFRIDISKSLNADEILRVLVHEFAHFLHFKQDASLKSLDFILDKPIDEYEEEFRLLTIESIPKNSIKPLFDKKDFLKKQEYELKNKLTKIYPDFKMSKPFNPIENKIQKTPYKYLLKHDRVKVFEYFSYKIYSIDSIEKYDLDANCRNYLELKSVQRQIKRINSKICKLNNYYNSPTELFARAMEAWFFEKEVFLNKAPALFAKFSKTFELNNIPELTKFNEIISC